MNTIRAADGGYLLNSEQFYYTKDRLNRPVLHVIHTEVEPTVTTDFVIGLTAISGQEGQYTANKGWIDIKAAYDNNENMIVSVNGAKLPMMNAEATADGDAGFTFGYTQVTTDGQLVSTRAINYYHTADTDEWTDADEVGEFVRLDDAITKSKVDLVRNSAVTIQLAPGTYLLSACDDIHRGLVCAFVQDGSTTISALTGCPGWEVTKGAVDNSLYINNKSDTTGLEVTVVPIV